MINNHSIKNGKLITLLSRYYDDRSVTLMDENMRNAWQRIHDYTHENYELMNKFIKSAYKDHSLLDDNNFMDQLNLFLNDDHIPFFGIG